MVREFPCRGCGKPMLLKGSYCYKAKDRVWKETEKEDLVGLNPEHVNTDSRTDIQFYCRECYAQYGPKA